MTICFALPMTSSKGAPPKKTRASWIDLMMNGQLPFLPVVLHLPTRRRLHPRRHLLLSLPLFLDRVDDTLDRGQGTGEPQLDELLVYAGANEPFLDHTLDIVEVGIRFLRILPGVELGRFGAPQILSYRVPGESEPSRDLLDMEPLRS